MNSGALRIATADGAMLADPSGLGKLAGTRADVLFDPAFWAARGELTPAARGRGAAWFIDLGDVQWALRHYRRGGFIARLSADRYVWAGEARVRAFAEWRLLEELSRRGLPVPVPVAARYQRSGGLGGWYRCDLLTRRIAAAEPLSERLAQGELGENVWRAVGVTLARLHRAGVDHADLNAHNILVDAAAVVSVIDFDRGRLRRPGAWAAGNLRRLRRSLDKISGPLPPGRFPSQAWHWLLAGYAA